MIVNVKHGRQSRYAVQFVVNGNKIKRQPEDRIRRCLGLTVCAQGV